jgi:hypothetical protein
MTKKEKRGMVIFLDHNDRANLKTLQGRIESVGVDKTMALLAYECFLIGLSERLHDTEKL